MKILTGMLLGIGLGFKPPRDLKARGIVELGIQCLKTPKTGIYQQ